MIWLLLFPLMSQAMDVNAIKKYSFEKYQALVIRPSFSEQEKKDFILSWFTLSLIPFLQAKQENKQDIMKQRLDDIAKTLDTYHKQKIFLKLNPFIVRDSMVEHSLDLMNESINCRSMLCCAACIKHDSYSEIQLKELSTQLGTIKLQAIEDLSLKDIDPAMTQLLFLIMDKLPNTTSEYVSTGYGDSFG